MMKDSQNHRDPMEFNHLHLYVDDLAHWRDQFVQRWGGQAQAVPPSVADHTALICLGRVPLVLSAPRTPQDAVATYLRQHPLGVGDIAFWVPDLEAALARLTAHDGPPPSPIVEDLAGGRWCQVQGWGSLRHTLVQSARPMAWVPGVGTIPTQDALSTGDAPFIDHIDHGVINVPVGQLAAAVDWYVQRFGFQPQQEFTIDTPWSGLRSQVLAHPHGGATLPINEPTTANSQVQEFLHWNRGPGVQHVALHTSDITQTVQRLKTLGITFLDVPDGYYQALAERPGYGVQPRDGATLPSVPGTASSDYLSSHPLIQDLVRLNILVDWDSQTPQAKLLQTFTQPVFNQPTLFFEIIQRQSAWAGTQPILAQGFGERNFKALFEAIEQEQRKRGSLVWGG